MVFHNRPRTNPKRIDISNQTCRAKLTRTWVMKFEDVHRKTTMSSKQMPTAYSERFSTRCGSLERMDCTRERERSCTFLRTGDTVSIDGLVIRRSYEKELGNPRNERKRLDRCRDRRGPGLSQQPTSLMALTRCSRLMLSYCIRLGCIISEKSSTLCIYVLIQECA